MLGVPPRNLPHFVRFSSESDRTFCAVVFHVEHHDSSRRAGHHRFTWNMILPTRLLLLARLLRSSSPRHPSRR